MAQFGLQAELPRNAGAKTISMFTVPDGDSSKVQTIVEGANPSARREAVLTKVDIPLVQYGEVAQISDIVQWTDMFQALQQHIDVMALDAALHADDVIRDAVVENVDTAGQKRYAQGLANWAALAAASASAGKIVPLDFMKAVTQLKKQRCPRLKGGGYGAVINPDVSYDFLDQMDDVVKYMDMKPIYNGEIGKYRNIRIFEATNPYIEDAGGAEDTFDATGDIFSTVFFGTGGWCVPKLSGTKIHTNKNKPQIIIVNKADSNNPLNLYMTAGWKSYWAAKIVREAWIVTVRAKSTFA